MATEKYTGGMKYLFILCCLAMSFAAPVAVAQTMGGAFEGMGDNDQPIQIEADSLEVIDDQNTALLTGNVSVVQGNTIFKASRVKVFYVGDKDKNQTQSGIKRIEARGKVAVTAEDSNATADSADIDMISEIIVLTGNVVMTQGENVATGCQVTINLKTTVTNMKPCAGERPTLVLQPKSRQ